MTCSAPAHSLKGAAGFLKLTDITTITHRLENLLDDIRHEKRAFDQHLIEVLFQACDAITMLLQEISEKPAVPFDSQQILQLLQQALEQQGSLPAEAETPNQTGSAIIDDQAFELVQDATLGEIPHWLIAVLDPIAACEAVVAEASSLDWATLRFPEGQAASYQEQLTSSGCQVFGPWNEQSFEIVVVLAKQPSFELAELLESLMQQASATGTIAWCRSNETMRWWPDDRQST